MTGAEVVLSIRDLNTYYHTKRRTVKACQQVNLELRRGEVFSLVGESACGKSTLGATLMNLLPDKTEVSGEIVFEGRNLLTVDPEGLRQIRGKKIALIFQDPMTRLDPLMTVEEHFSETLNSHGDVGKKEARRLAAVALDWIYRKEYVPLKDQINMLLTVSRQEVHELARQYRLSAATVVALGPLETL